MVGAKMPSKWQKNKSAPGPGRYSRTVPTLNSWCVPWHGLDNSHTPQAIPGLAFGGLAGCFQCGHLIFESRRFLAWGHNKSLPVGHRANLANLCGQHKVIQDPRDAVFLESWAVPPLA